MGGISVTSGGWREDVWSLLRQSGVVAESHPRNSSLSSQSALVSGRLIATAIPVETGTTITNALYISGATGASVPTHWWFALYDSSLALIRQSTDQLTTAMAADTQYPLALDSIPVTAGARVASSTVTLTIPTLSESLTRLVAVDDSIVVANADVAAYNGTFTVVSVDATTITYDCGDSSTDSLSSPFPTVKLASGKRTYTASARGIYYAGIMQVASTASTMMSNVTRNSVASQTTKLGGLSTTGLTGTAPAPAGAFSAITAVPYAQLS
jgi:hypothetical protein